MANLSNRLFPCTVMPGSAVGAIAKVHGVAVGAAVFVALSCWRLTGNTACVIPLAALAACADGNYFMDGKIERCGLAKFLREFEFHCGYECPSDAVEEVGPMWLGGVLVVILCLGVLPLIRPIVAYGLLTWWFMWLVKKTGFSFPSMLREYWNASFVFLAHPDESFVGPAGTSAIWIPSVTMPARWVEMLVLHLPLYFALCAGWDM